MSDMQTSRYPVQYPIIVALDFSSASQTLALVDQLDPNQCYVKVGKELFTREGPQILDALHQRGFKVFLDLKYHDIPNTVAKACAAAAERGVWMLNVHASGGLRMMQAAREAVSDVGSGSLLIAVTVLTSMADEELPLIGVNDRSETQVLRLARLAQQARMDGVVCSAQEAALLRNQLGDSFTLVTPGIRPADSDAGDQRRVVTPCDALASGVNYMVIGRPITQAPNPLQALESIVLSLGSASTC